MFKWWPPTLKISRYATGVFKWKLHRRHEVKGENKEMEGKSWVDETVTSTGRDTHLGSYH